MCSFVIAFHRSVNLFISNSSLLFIQIKQFYMLLLCYCDQLTDRNDLRKEGFIWTHGFRRLSPNICPHAVHYRADVKQRKGVQNEAKARYSL